MKLEAQRDLTQIIVHVDMDAFYANVEVLDNPSLKGKPFAVSGAPRSPSACHATRSRPGRQGDPDDRLLRGAKVRGAVRNVECAFHPFSCFPRQLILHVRQAFIAKKLCPELILVETHFARYMEMSRRVMDVFRRYDPNMCTAGCDEGYLK